MPESNKLLSNGGGGGGGSTNESSSSASSTSSSSSSSSIVLNSTKSSSSTSNNQNHQSSLSASAASAALQQVTEKPTHYTYLKGFRVEQCPLFLQHKCTQHRPYTCFYWHFKNQRRRRPIRKRDGTFNYNPDVYCEKYDEQSGVCPNSDECPFVHRNAGDTEKRYHLRYYKTAICIHETDNKGNCTKNGPHCAFAHGPADTRPPVYDAKELQQQQQQQQQQAHNHHHSNHHNHLHENSVGGSESQPPNGAATNGLVSSSGYGSNVNSDFLAQINEKTLSLSSNLEKERQLNEDPKWNDTNYVLINYKTEPCKRPPRLCRQGFACPQYHNARDKRRNPSVFKYRSTPCPNVKQGDDWLEPTVCENGDQCKYCHSRTEQQFHPEIYKSSKCNDMISTGYCPRGPFCAFAHIDQELKNQRAHSTSESSSSEYTLENFISTVLPLSSGSTTAATGKDLDGGGGGHDGELASSNGSGGGGVVGAENFDINESLLQLTLQQQRAVATAVACLNNKQLNDEQASALVQTALTGGAPPGGLQPTGEDFSYFLELSEMQRNQQLASQMGLSQLSYLNTNPGATTSSSSSSAASSTSSTAAANSLLIAGLNSALAAANVSASSSSSAAAAAARAAAASLAMYNKPIGSDRPLDRIKLLQQSTSISVTNPSSISSSNKPSPTPIGARASSPYQLIDTGTAATVTLDEQSMISKQLSRSAASPLSKAMATNLAVTGKLNMLQQQQQQHQSLLAAVGSSSSASSSSTQIHLNSNSSTTASSSSSPSPAAVAAAAAAGRPLVTGNTSSSSSSSASSTSSNTSSESHVASHTTTTQTIPTSTATTGASTSMSGASTSMSGASAASLTATLAALLQAQPDLLQKASTTLNLNNNNNASNNNNNNNYTNESLNKFLLTINQQNTNNSHTRRRASTNTTTTTTSGGAHSKITNQSTHLCLDEAGSIEKLREDLSRQMEVSSKLEEICIQYQEWIEKLSLEANEWKAKYTKCEAERKSLEIQLLNKNA